MRTSTGFVGAVCLFFSFWSCSEEAPPPPAVPAVPARPAAKPDAGVKPDASVDAGAGEAGTDGGPGDGGEGEDAGAPLDAFVEVASKPTGSPVTVDGQDAGETPVKVPVASGSKHQVKVARGGFFVETREVEPTAGETARVDVTLRPGATLRVTSDPPDASVTVNGELVLEATPGVTAAFAPNKSVEVAVSFPGYDTFTKKLKVKGEQKLDVKLTASIQVGITSSPTEAQVTLDGKPVGTTPVDVFLSARGKHTVAVTKPGWSTVKKVLSGPQKDLVHFTLSDLELEKYEADVAKALKAYDKANDALEATQKRAQENPKFEAQLEAAEAEMEKATAELEEAERQLAAAKAKRAR